MDNILIEKIYQDEDLLELKITAANEYVRVYQNCYISKEALISNISRLKDYVKKCEKKCYLEFGIKEGNYTPAFSICLLPADTNGHIRIEMDMEIADNDMRIHRCSFFVDSEIGTVERFSVKLEKILDIDFGSCISLTEI